jgi:phage N-6-adenine-methyltransferase
MSKADKDKLAYIGAKPGTNKNSLRDSDTWFTPSLYTDMATEVMGRIDLDPFSSDAANAQVKARRYFTIEHDAFQQTWFQEQGRVFMNPPYTRQIVDSAIELFLMHIDRGEITQGIVLVNNATETRWFQSLARRCSVACFPDRRIAFENVDGKHVSGNTRGQVFFYFGHRIERFHNVFGRIGTIFSRMD